MQGRCFANKEACNRIQPFVLLTTNFSFQFNGNKYLNKYNSTGNIFRVMDAINQNKISGLRRMEGGKRSLFCKRELVNKMLTGFRSCQLNLKIILLHQVKQVIS